jgi:hypothetical protein
MLTAHTTMSILTTAVLAVGLAGCTVQANRTVSASAFATTVADGLEESVGQRPDVDCGDDAIDVVDGEEVHCDVSTPGSDVLYDSVVTVSTDGGDDYSVAVEVDEEPKG